MPTHERLSADPVALHDLFSSDNELRCPLFQRRYVWSKRNVTRLWSDLDTLIDGEFDVRFLGALVFDNEKSSSAVSPGLYWIIDGQQRLTTIYLILLAMTEVAKEAGLNDEADAIVSEYLLSRKSQSRNQPKLMPTFEDTRQFNGILQMVLGEKVSLNRLHEYGESTGNMRDVYYNVILKETRKRCVNDNDKVDPVLFSKVYETFLEKVELVEIRLGRNHDPNEVFDRLNQEGEKLGIIDLVRNEVLKRMKDDPAQAENTYAQLWKPFEDSFGQAKNRDQYFFPFALSFDPSVTKSRTFQYLSDRWQSLCDGQDDPQTQVKKIMNDLNFHSSSFRALKEGQSLPVADKDVSKAVDRLHRLECPTVTYPYLMNLLTSYSNGEVQKENVVACCNVIESFLVRRAVVGLEPTGLHAVFKGLWFDSKENYKDLANKIQTTTIQFPDDEQFERAIKNAPMYKRKVCKFLVEEYELSHNGSKSLKKLPELTIDHVLPQEPDGEWLDIFSDKEIEVFVHTWANLVPLSASSNYSKGRSSWNETKDKLKNEAVFSTTNHLYDDYSEWTPASIRKRAEELFLWSKDRWPRNF